MDFLQRSANSIMPALLEIPYRSYAIYSAAPVLLFPAVLRCYWITKTFLKLYHDEDFKLVQAADHHYSHPVTERRMWDNWNSC